MTNRRRVDVVRERSHLRLVERGDGAVIAYPPVQASPPSGESPVALVGAWGGRTAHAAWGRVRRALLGGWARALLWWGSW